MWLFQASSDWKNDDVDEVKYVLWNIYFYLTLYEHRYKHNSFYQWRAKFIFLFSFREKSAVQKRMKREEIEFQKSLDAFSSNLYV